MKTQRTKLIEQKLRRIIREEIKRIRSKRLLEYLHDFNVYSGELFNEHDPIEVVEQINLLSDMIHDPFSNIYEEEDLEELHGLISKYEPIAKKLNSGIQSLNSKGWLLNDYAAEKLDDVWYDGSEGYDDTDIMVEELPSIYDAQIKVIKNILKNPSMYLTKNNE